MPWTKDDVDRFKSGLTDSQKEQWVEVANSALRRCLDNGGSQENCEGQAIRQANGVVGNMEAIANRISNTTVRRTTFYGRTHVVAPVVLMTAGIHHGSRGRVLYTAEELSRMPITWHGRPVPIMHPTDNDGSPRSCNDPDIMEAQAVGRVFNVEWEQGTQRLKGELWIDEQRAKEVCQRMNLPDVVNMIDQGQPVEVSTGLFPEQDGQGGALTNGQEYDATAIGIHADHLALLPGGRGACSWEDGCGVRNQEEQGGSMQRTKPPTKNKGALTQNDSFIKDAIHQGFFVVANLGFREVTSKIQQQLDAMDNDYKIHFLEEVYDDGTMIYRVENRESNSTKLYKRGYSVNDDGSIDFEDEPVEVNKQVNYVEVTGPQNQEQNTNQNTEKEADMGEKNTEQQNQQGCCPEKVEAVINSSANSFTEDDREKLQALEEAVIDKIPTEESQTQTQEDGGTQNHQPQNQEEQKVDFNTLLANADPETRESIERGRELYRQERNDLTQHILRNSDQFTQEELDKMDHTMLQKVANSMPKPVNHRLRGGPASTVENTDDREEGLPLPGIQNTQPETETKQ